MKVYVVTSGMYSDYSIHGIFSSKKNAQRYVENCESSKECWHRGGFNDIQEWEVNEALKECEYTQHSAAIFLDTGESEHHPSSRQYWGIPESSHYIAEHVPAYEGRGVVRAESHKSQKHAMKIAVEARQKYLRESRHDQPRT